VAIVGAGPIGLAALLTAQFYSPATIIMIDLDDNRLEMAKRFGATAVINSTDGRALETVLKLTGNRGVDAAIEAVGVPAAFELLQIRTHFRRLRDFRQGRQDKRAQGDHRGLAPAAPWRLPRLRDLETME
jgi:threonine dehydrogenase-like Zn-dependent dehydrogenase